MLTEQKRKKKKEKSKTLSKFTNTCLRLYMVALYARENYKNRVGLRTFSYRTFETLDRSSSRGANYFAPAISEATSAKHSGQTAKGKRPQKRYFRSRYTLKPIRTLVYAMRVILRSPFSLDFSASNKRNLVLTEEYSRDENSENRT